MLLRFLFAPVFAACLSVPAWADDYEEALSRIDSLTMDQTADLTVGFFADMAVNCRVELHRSDFPDEDVFRERLIVSFLTNLSVPLEHHTRLAPMLEQKLDSFGVDVDAKIEQRFDVHFEEVETEDQSFVLRERNCETSNP
ncbi:hypothetical protein [Yoonia sp. BS5-3]|uniref:Uncharacterized protein n=1 Tax=Yoonia phaeophyticola TaxID=3137369 RepID=A0ABZ2V2A7_9RHOB